jgi:hypothetical protein
MDSIKKIEICANYHRAWHRRGVAGSPAFPATEEPVEKLTNSTAFGGWWGIHKYADGLVLKRFRGWPSRPHSEKVWADHRAESVRMNEQFQAEWPALPVSGEEGRMLAWESAEELLERTSAPNSRKDRAAVELLGRLEELFNIVPGRFKK